jgi:hypothetical protein
MAMEIKSIQQDVRTVYLRGSAAQAIFAVIGQYTPCSTEQ